MQNELREKVIVVTDLSRYSDIAKELEQHFDAQAVAQLNKQIQALIASALQVIGKAIPDIPYKATGDGAIIALDNAVEASEFATALHRAAEVHNLSKDVPLAQRHFRIGIYTDQIVIERCITSSGKCVSFDIAGLAIANAVRFEAACRTGEVLISPDTWGNLPQTMRRLYGDQEVIRGKRNEQFRAHRRRVIAPAPWDIDQVRSDPKAVGEALETKPRPHSATMQAVYQLRPLRELLSSAFDDDALQNFCLDHFRDIQRQFTAGQTQDQRVRMLITHADTHGQLTKLVELIHMLRPEKYTEYESRLRG